MILSEAQIAQLAHAAGVPAAQLPTCVAIAIAESGGSSTAVGDVTLETSTWGPSIGLWQIRSLKADYGKGTPRDGSRLTDPAFNASAMYAISGHGSNWSPWSTFKSGAYRRYLTGAAAAAQRVAGGAAAEPVGLVIPNPLLPGMPLPIPGIGGGGSSSGGAAGGITGALGLAPVAQFFTALSDPNTWLRVLQVLVGAMAMAYGANVLSRGAVGNYVHEAASAGAHIAATAAMA